MKNKSIGSIRLDFFSRNEVKVTDNIPDPGDKEENYSAPVPFVYAAKLLYNFPPPLGDAAVKTAMASFEQKLNKNDISLLGICCKEPLEIVEKPGTGNWVYTCKFYLANGMVIGETKIAKGDEDYFHRAAMDTVFEWFKRRWKKTFEIDIGAVSLIGTSMCLFVYSFFQNLGDPQKGVINMAQNYRIANECAAAWTSHIAQQSR